MAAGKFVSWQRHYEVTGSDDDMTQSPRKTEDGAPARTWLGQRREQAGLAKNFEIRTASSAQRGWKPYVHTLHVHPQQLRPKITHDWHEIAST